jgi:hypothetical protein
MAKRGVGESLVRGADFGTRGVFHDVNLTLIASAMRGVIEVQVVSKGVYCATVFRAERGRHDQCFSVGVILENDQLSIEGQGLLIVQVVI